MFRAETPGVCGVTERFSVPGLQWTNAARMVFARNLLNLFRWPMGARWRLTAALVNEFACRLPNVLAIWPENSGISDSRSCLSAFTRQTRTVARGCGLQVGVVVVEGVGGVCGLRRAVGVAGLFLSYVSVLVSSSMPTSAFLTRCIGTMCLSSARFRITEITTSGYVLIS